MAVIVPTADDSGASTPLKNPKINGFTTMLVFMAAVGGFLFGYDTGIVSSAMLYVENNASIGQLSTFWKELIVAITPGSAIFGALFAGPAADRFGRRPLILVSSAVFAIGAVFCGIAVDKWILLIGRLLLGVAIGFSSMIVSMFVSEASPKHARGALLTFCNAAITFGQMAANIIAGGFSYVDPDNVGWRLMFGFAAIPAVIQFVGFLFLPESPRWLLKRGQQTKSRAVLNRIYGGDEDWVKFEITEIQERLQQEKLNESEGKVLRRILTTPHIRKALIIGCALQAFQQLGGINTIMYYTGAIIKAAGVRDNRTTIWLSVLTSGVNFGGTLIPMFLVDRLGRRKMLIFSGLGVVCSLCLVGGAFLLVNHDTAKTLANPVNSPIFDSGVQNYGRCADHSNCDYCTTDEHCGFCAVAGQGKVDGFCLPVSWTNGAEASATGFCSSGSRNASSYEWTDVYCHTKFTALPIVIMVVYLIFFSSGMGPAPWILNAEFYPLWARGTCISIATAVNWMLNLVVSLTFLTLTEVLTKFGTFFFYALITFGGVIVFGLFVPETKGRSLDEIEALFMDERERSEFSKPKSSPKKHVDSF